MLQGILHDSMMWLQDTGILSKMKMAFLPHGRPQPKSPKLRRNMTLSVWHLTTPLVIQAIGTAVALLSFGVELILSRKKLWGMILDWGMGTDAPAKSVAGAKAAVKSRFPVDSKHGARWVLTSSKLGYRQTIARSLHMH